MFAFSLYVVRYYENNLEYLDHGYLYDKCIKQYKTLTINRDEYINWISKDDIPIIIADKMVKCFGPFLFDMDLTDIRNTKSYVIFDILREFKK